MMTAAKMVMEKQTVKIVFCTYYLENRHMKALGGNDNLKHVW